MSNVGGMQRVATELYAALREHPDVELSEHLLQSTWKRHWFEGPFYLTRGYRKIRKMIERREVDAVLFTSIVTAALMFPPFERRARNDVAMAAIVHGRDAMRPRGPYQVLVNRAFGLLDAVLPVSRATGEMCVQRGFPAEKVQVVPNGVNTARFRSLEDATTMRRALVDTLGDPARPLPDDALLLCSVGRQVPRKGFAWFIDQVMPLLPEAVHYWLVGEGPEAENIRAAIARQGLEHRVRLLGRVSDEDLETFYRGADLFIMPNIPVEGDMEGFGVVMLEAGMSGLPAIAARLEGIRDVITEGRNGHLLESGDAWAFSETIMQYHHDRNALSEASQRAARFTRETFSWPAVANRYVEVMKSLSTPSLVGKGVEIIDA